MVKYFTLFATYLWDFYTLQNWNSILIKHHASAAKALATTFLLSFSMILTTLDTL